MTRRKEGERRRKKKKRYSKEHSGTGGEINLREGQLLIVAPRVLLLLLMWLLLGLWGSGEVNVHVVVHNKWRLGLVLAGSFERWAAHGDGPHEASSGGDRQQYEEHQY